MTKKIDVNLLNRQDARAKIVDLIEYRESMLALDRQRSAATKAREIRELLIEKFDLLEADFIIESLTHLGHAPNILYDDNGHFGISADGFQPVVTGSKKLEGSIHILVEKHIWHRTIRGAIKIYLKK